ncbi:MAG: alpha/beta fold hydrolase, partial [Myxococcales bacterium]|nr:alpha/beta fold hydrolase [Myxococcales bacterium]
RRRTAPLRLLAVAALACGCPAFHAAAFPDDRPGRLFATVDGVALRYTDRGQGPAVVLLHGYGSSLDVWDPVVPALETRHRVVALDLKGFGRSARPEGDYSPAAQAALVLGLLDRLGIDRTAVVAHSWGSSVALALALAAPERVTRLALYDAWVYEEQLPPFLLWSRAPGLGEFLFAGWYAERVADKMALAFYDPTRLTQELVDALEEALERPGTVAAALAAARGQRFEAIEGRYGTIDRPVLLLWGREDAVSPPAIGERLAAELPDARLVVYPRCGHFPMVEALAASTRDLVEFLAADLAGSGTGVAPDGSAPAPPPDASVPDGAAAARPAADLSATGGAP